MSMKRHAPYQIVAVILAASLVSLISMPHMITALTTDDRIAVLCGQSKLPRMMNGRQRSTNGSHRTANDSHSFANTRHRTVNDRPRTANPPHLTANHLH